MTDFELDVPLRMSMIVPAPRSFHVHEDGVEFAPPQAIARRAQRRAIDSIWLRISLPAGNGGHSRVVALQHTSTNSKRHRAGSWRSKCSTANLEIFLMGLQSPNNKARTPRTVRGFFAHLVPQSESTPRTLFEVPCQSVDRDPGDLNIDGLLPGFTWFGTKRMPQTSPAAWTRAASGRSNPVLRHRPIRRRNPAMES